MEQAKKPNAAIVALIVIVLIGAVAGGAFYVVNNKDTTTGSQQEVITPPSDTPSQGSDAVAETFKDGVYTATGSYLSPGGEESVGVEITLKNDVITSATVSPHAASSTSTQYQGEFVANFKPLVIGKDISEVRLSRVAGSSLTSGGFNEALEQIKSEAKS